VFTRALLLTLAVLTGCGPGGEIDAPPLPPAAPPEQPTQVEPATPPSQPSTPPAARPIPLEIGSTRPFEQAFGVGVNTTVSALFNAALKPQTFDATTFKLKYGTVEVPCEVRVSGNVATLTPAKDLLPNATYRVVVSKSVEDASGTPLGSDWSFTFTTGSNATPPVIIANTPSYNQSEVAIAPTLAATFTARLDAETIDANSFTLEDETGVRIAGHVDYRAGVATFQPAGRLGERTRYLAKISTSVRNELGQPLETPYEWTFVTGALND
jgi:predicted small lipoprotein YifL